MGEWRYSSIRTSSRQQVPVLYPRGKNSGIHWIGGCVSHRPGEQEDDEEEETYLNNKQHYKSSTQIIIIIIIIIIINVSSHIIS
jgi:hypothetical protein